MFRRRAKLGLSRKIVAYYLFFCLIAVCWLSAGAVVTSRAVVESRSTSACLTRLGSASAAAKIQLGLGNPDGCEQLLAALSAECRATWCAIVGSDGKIRHHTQAQHVGHPAEEPAGERVAWGEVTRLEYEGSDGWRVHEYHAPLISRGQRLGELRVAVQQPGLWATIEAAAPMAPAAVLAPLVLVVVGACVLRRLSKPVAEVEALLQEIARQPLDSNLVLTPVRARDASSLGWNRIVDALADCQRQARQGDVEATLARAAVSQNDAQFEAVLQRLTDGVAVTDATGRIEFANQAVAALLGSDADATALAGDLLEDRLYALDGGACRDVLAPPAARRRATVCELVQPGDESERVLRIARLPLGDDAAARFVWSLRDVTQQKLAEQTRDRFIDTATHELRTPLTNIKAYAETLATSDYIDVELQKEFCNIINSEVTRLARFIDDLLSISSMEVGALTIDRQKVETLRMFAEVLAKVEPQMQKKSIQFQTSLPPKLPEIQLDKDKIVAVAVNILGNAAKYTPEGGRVALKVKAEEGYLRIAVEDTGVGIAEEEIPKVFDKFFRSDDPRVQAEVGSGLGLSLAREVVRMHGGEITVESVLNQGSTFTILLPLE
jgi:signal transduction histidine kinase